MTAGLLAGTWAVITTPAPVAGQDNLASAAPLDLAAMALNPLDLAAFGLQPYGIGDARYLDAVAAGNLIAESHAVPASDISALLDANGLLQAYTLTNDNLTSPGAEGANLNGFVQSTVLRLPDETTASAVYTVITDWSAAGEVTTAEPPSAPGDEAQSASYTIGGGEGPSYQMTQTTFRADKFVAWVSLGTRESPPDAGQLTASMAARFAEKMTIIDGGNGPDLSYRALSIEGIAPSFGGYTAAYGGQLRLASEDDDTFQARSGQAAGLTDAYRQRIMLPGTDRLAVIGTDLLRFNSSADASGWVASAADRLQQQAGITDVAVDAAAPEIGDASATIGYQSADGQAGRQVIAQSGSLVMTISAEGAPDTLPAILGLLAPAQLACLTVDAACAPVRLPALQESTPLPVASSTAPPTSTATVVPTIVPSPTVTTEPPAIPAVSTPRVATPSVSAAVSPEATPAASPISSPAVASSPVASPATPTGSELYRNPDYPFTVSFDSSQWRIEQQGNTNERSFALYTNDTSLVYLIASDVYGSDVNACVQDAARSLASETGVTAVSPGTDASGNLLEGTGNDGAYAVYTYDTANGIPAARYFQCQVLVPGESTLLIMQIVSQQAFNDQVDDRSAFIQGIYIESMP